MAYQISLDQLLNLIFARLEILENLVEELRMRNNVLMRMLAEKVDVKKEDIHSAVEEELKIMEEVGLLEGEGIPEMIETLTEEIHKWLEGDVKDLKEKIREYKEKLKEREKLQKERKIDIAPADFLHRLDQMKKRL